MDKLAFFSRKKLRPFYEKNKNKIRSIFIAVTVIFCIVIDFPVIAYFINSPILQYGGVYLLTLTKIIFIILATPSALIAFFIGYRIDQTKYSKIPFNYPPRVEITGLLVGITLGLYFSVLWTYIITLTQGTLLTDPTLYITFPLLTTLITYLIFKSTQFIYSKMYILNHKDNFKIPLFIFILTIPFFIYTIYSLDQISHQIALQNEAAINNFQEFPGIDSYNFAADITVPATQVYNITALIGSSTQPNGVIRINGVKNFGGLDNYLLYKGMNTFTFEPNAGVCQFENTPIFTTQMTVYIRKLLSDQFATTVRKTITETVKCNMPKE
jgi:hypothetical protein